MIRKAAQGDEQAFRMIVEQYKHFVYAICKNIIKDPHEAENLTQETFLQVYKSLRNYQYKGFKTWIGRIATNKSIDYKRKLMTRQKQEIQPIEEMEQIPDDTPSVQEKILKNEEKEQLNVFLSELPQQYQTVILKYYAENKSYQQIAKEEHVSIKTIETRLYRGKKLLKYRFEEAKEG
jgi:RNA polymerase sigma factor (sigma-70 family)